MSSTKIESNQMQIMAQVVAPPSTAITIYPVKDMFITKQYPVFSFGEYNQLFVRKNTDTECRAIFSFDIPNIEDNIWKNFIDCKIKISFSYVPRATTIVLRQIDDDGWSETGVTWAGKPVEYPEILATYEINENTKEITYDIQDYLASLKGERGNFAFIIEEVNNDEQDTDIEIYSKESSVLALRPQIVAEYEYFPDNPDLADLNGSVIVQCNTGANLRSSIRIKNGVPAPLDLPATIKVKGYSTAVNGITFSMYTVAKTIKDIRFSFIVRRWAHKDLRARGFRLQRKDANLDLRAPSFSTIIHRHEIPGSLTIPLYSDTQQLPMSFAVKKYATAQFSGEFIIGSHKSRAQFGMSFVVRKTISACAPEYGTSEYDEYLKSSLTSWVTVNTYRDKADFTGSVSVLSRKDLPATMFINYYEDFEGFEGTGLYVKPHADLVSDNFSVNKIEEKSLPVPVFIVRPSWAYDMTVTSRVVKDQRRPYAYIT